MGLATPLTFSQTPIIFEKSLKLLASLATFPNFEGLLRAATGLAEDDQVEPKMVKYAETIRSVMGGGIGPTGVSVICE